MPAIEPPKPPAGAQGFDEAAMERLDALLREECGPNAGLPLEAVDGLFSAALVSPGEPISFQEACQKALGDMTTPPSAELVGLLFALWAWISNRVTQPASEDDPEQSLPLLAWPLEQDEASGEEMDFPVGAAWAVGFAMGSGLREAEWQARMEAHELVSDDLAEIFSLMPEFETDITVTSLKPNSQGYGISDEGAALLEKMQAEGHNIDMVKRLQIVDLLPDILHDFHCLCLEEYDLQQQENPQAGSSLNATCPCGSGLPFKSCHGDPSRLN